MVLAGVITPKTKARLTNFLPIWTNYDTINPPLLIYCAVTLFIFITLYIKPKYDPPPPSFEILGGHNQNLFFQRLFML